MPKNIPSDLDQFPSEAGVPCTHFEFFSYHLCDGSLVIGVNTPTHCLFRVRVKPLGPNAPPLAPLDVRVWLGPHVDGPPSTEHD